MPSGRTHDSITLWSLPLIAGVTFERTRSSSLALLVSAGFLFSGLMFGPDLDVYSRQYKRWGPLRWIWLPYRKVLRHRSLLSHGPIVGTVGRIAYLLAWLSVFGFAVILLGAIAGQALGMTRDWQPLAQQVLQTSAAQIGRSLQQFPIEWLAVGVGLELGALSHSVSDWVGSALKRGSKRSKKRLALRAATPAPEVAEEFDPLAEPLTDDLDAFTEADSDLIDLLTSKQSGLPMQLPAQTQPASIQRQSPPVPRPPRKPESWKGPELPPFVGK